MRSRTFIVIMLLLVPAALATSFDPDVASITESVNQSDSWSYDFNASYANATSIPEDGSDVTFVIDDTNLTGLSINPNTGVMGFTPQNADVGSYGIYVDLRNTTTTLREDSVFINLTIININDAPTITGTAPASPISADENTTVNVTFNASDPDRFYDEVLNGTFFVERPINTTINSTSVITGGNGAASFSYDIGFCDAGVVTITGIAEDDEGLNDTTNWTLDVADVNRNVTFNGTIANQTFNESQGLVANFTYDERFLDPDDLVCGDETFTFTLDSASETTISVNQTSGVVTFNSTPGWYGNETVTLTANDGEADATSNSFTIEVIPIPDTPVGIAPGAKIAYENVAFTTYVRFEDADLPYGDNLTFSLNDSNLGTSPLSISTFNKSGNASYAKLNTTPQSADIGTYAYRVIANDSTGLTANVTFTIDVQPNAAPNITTPLMIPEATQDIEYTALLNATEDDGEAVSWFVSIVTSNGSLNAGVFGLPYNSTVGGYPLASLNDTQGELSFTPDNEEVGTYTLMIYAVDPKGAVDNVTTQLAIANVNDPPENLAPNGTLKAKTDEQWNYTATVDDPDFDYGDFVTISVNDSDIAITNLTMTGSEWRMTWTPNTSHIGNRSIELNATDTSGASITTTFTLEVLAPAAPILEPIENLTAQATVDYYNRIEATDPNGDPITFTFNDSIWSGYVGPTGSDFAIINATDYDSGDEGTYSINVTAYDAADNLSDWVVVEFVVEPFNLPPNLSDARDISFVVGNESTYNFTVQDAENNNWTAYFDTIDWINTTRVNDTLQLTGTPDVGNVGLIVDNLTINQTDFPPRNTTYVFNVTVFSDPQEPEITSLTPVFDPSDTEAGSRTYSVTIDDPNFPRVGSNETDAVTIEWIFNDEIVLTRTVNSSVTDEYEFEYDYCSAPGGTLEVNLTDLSDLTTATSWTVTIANVNRAPYFGERRFTTQDVLSWTATNASSIGTAIEQDSASAPGRLVSSVFDLGRENSINKAQITSVSIPMGGGPVSYELRFNSNSNQTGDPSWSNWTDLAAVGTAPSNVTIRQYAQIRFTLNSTDSGNLSRVVNATLNYGFSNQTINSSSTFLDYYYLDDYFTDEDFEECEGETLNVSVSPYPGESAFTTDVTIDELSRTVDIVTQTSFGYTDYPQFTFTDSDGANVSSNYYGITVEERPDQVNVPQPTSSGGGGGGGSSTSLISEPQDVDVPDPEPLDIITPGSVTMSANETLSIPITITNRWNETLENIVLSAVSENENTSLSFTRSQLGALASGVNETVNLTVVSYATYGSYDITVTASVDEPEYNTSATIIVSSIELGQEGNETFNTKLTFARDIVSSNPRCLELNEQIERARDLITGGAIAQASALLDDIVENCRYLINLDDDELTGQEELTFIDRLMRETSTETKTYASVIVLVTVLLLLFVGAYVLRRPGAP